MSTAIAQSNQEKFFTGLLILPKDPEDVMGKNFIVPPEVALRAEEKGLVIKPVKINRLTREVEAYQIV